MKMFKIKDSFKKNQTEFFSLEKGNKNVKFQ